MSSHETRNKQTLSDGHSAKYLTSLLFKSAMVIKNKGTLKTQIREKRRYIKTKYNIVSWVESQYRKQTCGGNWSNSNKACRLVNSVVLMLIF